LLCFLIGKIYCDENDFPLKKEDDIFMDVFMKLTLYFFLLNAFILKGVSSSQIVTDDQQMTKQFQELHI